MPMNLLDNELIRKYFGCDVHAGHCELLWVPCKQEGALKIIRAMQEPIKKGERYIVTYDDKTWNESVRTTPDSNDTRDFWHPDELRIPDAFQPKAECCDNKFSGTCPTCGSKHQCQKPDPVEESSKEILNTVEIHGKLWLEMKLRELVALARETQMTRPPARGKGMG